MEDSSKRHIPPNGDKDYWKRMEQGNRTKAFLEETPRSILKHRQIIENNVPVQSKYNHTPTIGNENIIDYGMVWYGNSLFDITEKYIVIAKYLIKYMIYV